MSFARSQRSGPWRAGEPAMGSVRGKGESSLGATFDLFNPGWITVLATLGLCAIGLHAIDISGGGGPESARLVQRQLMLGFIGVGAGAAVMVPHFKLIGRLTPVFAIITLGLLVVLIIPGVPDWLVTPRKGARRWINLGVTDIQPSELAKVVYVLAVARYLRFRRNHRRFLGLAMPAVITFVPMGLIVVEPDLGTALLFLPTLFAMLIAGGAKLKHLILVTVVALALAPAMYPLLQPHQKARVQALVNQFTGDRSQAQGINFQGDTAMTLIGAGQAAGTPAEKAAALVVYSRLPERHNDMIFAVLGVRFGLAGAAAVLGLYALWIAGAMLTAARTKDPFGRLVCVGLASTIAVQMLLNVGENVGVLPITGTTLPFVSYGGSSLVVGFIIVGLIANIGMRRPAYLARQSFEFDDEDDDA